MGFEQAPGHVWEGRTVSGGGYLFASNVSTLIRVHDVFWPKTSKRFEPALPQKRFSTKKRDSCYATLVNVCFKNVLQTDVQIVENLSRDGFT